MKQNVKDRILESANILFANHGFNGTSMRDISANADVSLSMINYHFLSKSNLLFEIISQFTDKLKVKLIELSADDSLSDWERVKETIISLVDISFKELNTLKILTQEDHLTVDDEVKNLLQEFSDFFRTILQNSLIIGMRNKSFNIYFNPNFLATLIIGVMSTFKNELHEYSFKKTNYQIALEIDNKKTYLKTELLKLFKHILTTPINN